MRFQTALLMGMAAALYLAAVHADTPIYKWVDDQGKVHYSTEPHGDKAQQLAISNTANAPSAGTSAAPSSATVQAANDATLARPQASDSPACKEARERFFTFLHSDHLYSVDGQGNKTELSPEDQQKAIDDARANASRACNGGGS